MAASLYTITGHGVAAASWRAFHYHSPNDLLANPSHKLRLRRESPLLLPQLPFKNSHRQRLISSSALFNSPGKLQLDIIPRCFSAVLFSIDSWNFSKKSKTCEVLYSSITVVFTEGKSEKLFIEMEIHFGFFFLQHIKFLISVFRSHSSGISNTLPHTI